MGEGVDRRGASDFSTSNSAAASADTLDMLRAQDLGLRIRRLRLLARRATELDQENSRAELAPIRTAIYDSLAGHLECQRAAPFLGRSE